MNLILYSLTRKHTGVTKKFLQFENWKNVTKGWNTRYITFGYILIAGGRIYNVLVPCRESCVDLWF